MKHGRSVTASGKVTPTSLAGSEVMLTVQHKQGAKWIKVKTGFTTITSAGKYSWKYTPTKEGSYRLQCSIAKTEAHAAASTDWVAFKVK